MKLIRFLLTAFLLISGSKGLHAAQTAMLIHISGSSSFRATAQQTALDYLNGISYPTTGSATYCYSGNMGLQAADAANFRAVVDSNGDSIEIQTNFAGSIVGLVATAAHSTTATGSMTFIDAVSTGSLTGQDGARVGSIRVPSDVVLSDVYANTPSVVSNPAYNYTNLLALGPDYMNGIVGVMPFEFVTRNNLLTSGASLTNITSNQVKDLFRYGVNGLKGSVFSGNSVDTADYVYSLAGDDGSVATMFADANLTNRSIPSLNCILYSIKGVSVLSGGTGYLPTDTVVLSDKMLNNGTFGYFNKKNVFVPYPLTSGIGAKGNLTVDGNGSITGVVVTTSGNGYYNPTIFITSSTGSGAVFQLNLGLATCIGFPAYASFTTGLTYAPGTRGYNSNNNLITASVILPEASVSHYITFLSEKDAESAIQQGAVPLSFEGVPFSSDNVVNGAYTCWCYEHAYCSKQITGPLLSRINGYTYKLIPNLRLSGAIPTSLMKVSRLNNGPNVTAGARTYDGGSVQ